MICLLGASALDAQCADGSPPPCPAPTRAPAPDPNRVAVLPFRVTTSDTLLGEGFAELLASEFTGEGVPRAVDMGSVIQSWRKAGGTTRNHLTRAQSLEIARRVGAGILGEGSIVGLGRQITVTASLFDAVTGTSRGRSARVTVSSDSLDQAIQRVAAQLIGTSDARADARNSDSPEAIRAYMRGLREWRRGNLQGAASQFDAAIAIDSGFAQAIYRRFLAGTWGVFTSISESVVWKHRDRLPPQDRELLVALLGEHFPAPRTIVARVADFDALHARRPDSPDVLYFLGDDWYHFGGLLDDPARALRRARDYFERAAAADSQATVLVHLAAIAIQQRDTALLRRAARAYERTGAPDSWIASWIAASELRDRAWLAALRRAPPSDVRSLNVPVLLSVTYSSIAPGDMEELFRRWGDARPEARPGIDLWRGLYKAWRGQPAAAEQLWRTLSTGLVKEMADVVRLMFALADGDGEAAALHESLRQIPKWDSAASPIARFASCGALAWRKRRGDSVSADSNCRRDMPVSAWTLDLMQTPLDRGQTSVAALERADSTFLALLSQVSVPLIGGYEGFLLARAWERVGHPDRALRALRRYQMNGLTWGLATIHDYEGRLAAQVGDVPGAIAATRRFLEIMEHADPVFADRIAAARALLVQLESRP